MNPRCKPYMDPFYNKWNMYIAVGSFLTSTSFNKYLWKLLWACIFKRIKRVQRFMKRFISTHVGSLKWRRKSDCIVLPSTNKHWRGDRAINSDLSYSFYLTNKFNSVKVSKGKRQKAAWKIVYSAVLSSIYNEPVYHIEARCELNEQKNNKSWIENI